MVFLYLSCTTHHQIPEKSGTKSIPQEKLSIRLLKRRLSLARVKPLEGDYLIVSL